MARSCAAALLLAVASSCSEPARPSVVVFVEVDTLRADALGCYGNSSRGENGAAPSPAIDALAREGVLFERAYSAAPWTIPSLATQLTGLWPWDHGALRLLHPLDPDLVTLPERFRAAGWRTAGVTTNFVAKGEYGFDRGFDRWDQTNATGHEGSTAHAAVSTLLAFADDLARDPGEGLFLFLLLFEPHYRYEDQPGLRFGPGWPGGAPYRGRLTGREDFPALQRERHELDEVDVAFLRGRYQGEVARADEAVGRLLAELDLRGMEDDALVVFTADHGEEIMDRGWIGHTRTLHEELVRVPLVIRTSRGIAAARRGARVTHPLSQIDLGATVLELAGIDGGLGTGFSFAGSVLGNAEPRRRYLYFHTDYEPPLSSADAAEKRALQWGVLDSEVDLKWIVDRLAVPPVAHLFDLARDPGEARDLAAQQDPPPNLVRLTALDPDLAWGDATPLPVGDEGVP